MPEHSTMDFIFTYPDEMVEKLLTLLDCIEVQEDHTLAEQRFDILEEFGFELILKERTSGSLN